MKKLTLISLAAATAMFMACGDDSSSGSSSGDANKDSKGRTIYTDMQEALEAPCSEENKCEVIILDDPMVQDTLQCTGKNFQSMLGGKPLSMCEEEPESSDSEGDEGDISSDSNDESSDSEGDDESSSSEQKSVIGGDESSSSEQKAVIGGDESSSSEEQGPTGSLVSCEVTVDGIFGEHSCAEASASDTDLPALCQQIASFGDGMSATEGTSCNAPATAIKCVKNGMNFYILDDKESCDEFYEATVFQTLVGTSVSM